MSEILFKHGKVLIVDGDTEDEDEHMAEAGKEGPGDLADVVNDLFAHLMKPEYHEKQDKIFPFLKICD